MQQVIDPKPLRAFFQEVKELLDISLVLVPDNTTYPIQVDSPDGVTRDRAHELLNFIKSQCDLRDNEIAHIHNLPKSHKVKLEITQKAAVSLSEIYALSSFYDPDDDE